MFTIFNSPKIELRPDAKINFSSSFHLTPEEVDEVGLLVAEQVDEHLVLHLGEGDPDGGPGQTVSGAVGILFLKGVWINILDRHGVRCYGDKGV